MVATETKAAPAESTGPTVNIQTTEAAEAEPVHATAEFAVKTMPAEGALDYVVVLQEDISGGILGDPRADSVSCEKSDVAGIALSSEELEQRASVEQVAEEQAVATHLGLVEGLCGSSALPEAAVLSSAAEKENEEAIDEEGEDAGVERVAIMSKDESDCSRFTVARAYIGDSEKEEKLLSTEEEHSEGEAAESCLEALADFKNAGERKHIEVDGKRVQFSNEVQYFEEQEFPTESEDGIEEADEERDECSPAEDEGRNILKRLPFEKEKYYYVQMDSSEDEIERTEEEETDGKEEELEEEYDEEELNLKLAEDCVDKKASAVRGDVLASEEVKEEEMVRAEVLKKGEIEEQDQKSGPREVTPTEPLTSDAPLTHPAVSQSEVTLHQLQWPQPRPCNLTSTLPSCRHNLPLIIKGKTRPQAWICVSTC